MSGMRLPQRSAPPPPASSKRVQSSSWDDSFCEGSFDGNRQLQKKKPPPRPPPPKLDSKNAAKPNIPSRPAHFNRKPTVLSTLIGRPKRVPETGTGDSNFRTPSSPLDDRNGGPSLIDLSSPPCSPTLTTRSSSDGLSVDSFGSDITSSIGGGNINANCGNSSQTESGFEDDFDLLSSNRKTTPVDADSWLSFDPFSPPKTNQKTNFVKPVYDSDFLDPLCNGKSVASNVQTHNKPTIIRPKPARPKAPKDSALLSSVTLNSTNKKSSFNTSTKININLQIGELRSTFEPREESPPMPSIPPPPPPLLNDVDKLDSSIPLYEWDRSHNLNNIAESCNEEPYAIALYDYPGSLDDDLPFMANDKIRLIRQLNGEWLYGKLRSGMEGMFPSNYVEIKVPLEVKNNPTPQSFNQNASYVSAMFDFEPQEEGDLPLKVGDRVKVLSKLSNEWLYGEVNGKCGQFPANYVDNIPIF